MVLHQTALGDLTSNAIEHAYGLSRRTGEPDHNGAGGSGLLRIRVIPPDGIRITAGRQQHVTTMDGQPSKVRFGGFDRGGDTWRFHESFNVALQPRVDGVGVYLDLRCSLRLRP